MERNCGPMNKNRIEGAADQGERAMNREALVTKGKRRRPGGRAAKECVLTLAQTPGVWSDLDKWMRHRVRAVQLKQWKRGKTMYRELLALGAKPDVARQIAANSRRWQRNSGKLLNSVLTPRWADQLRIPRLS